MALRYKNKVVLLNNLLPESERYFSTLSFPRLKDSYLIPSELINEDLLSIQIQEFEHEITKINSIKIKEIYSDSEVYISEGNNLVGIQREILPQKIITNKSKELKKPFIFEGNKGDFLDVTFDLEDVALNRAKVFLKLETCIRGYYNTKESYKEKTIPINLKKLTKSGLLASTLFFQSDFIDMGMALVCCGKGYGDGIGEVSISIKHSGKELYMHHPRELFTPNYVVDISSLIKKKKNSLLFRLEWTRFHKLRDISLLVEDKACKINIEEYKVKGIYHSEDNFKDNKINFEELELKPDSIIEIPLDKNIKKKGIKYLLFEIEGSYKMLDEKGKIKLINGVDFL